MARLEAPLPPPSLSSAHAPLPLTWHFSPPLPWIPLLRSREGTVSCQLLLHQMWKGRFLCPCPTLQGLLIQPTIPEGLRQRLPGPGPGPEPRPQRRLCSRPGLFLLYLVLLEADANSLLRLTLGEPRPTRSSTSPCSKCLASGLSPSRPPPGLGK